MFNNSTNQTSMLTKAIVLGIALITTIVMTGFTSALPTNAQSQSIVDGALIKTDGNPDIYIVKLVNGKQFRRLILNPTIFDSYGHLSWDNVLTVSTSVMNSYTVSDLVREIYPDGSIVPPGNIYKLYPQGDTGVKRLLQITQAEFESKFDKDSIYSINHLEAGPTFYELGAPITSANLHTISTTSATTSPAPAPTATNIDAPETPVADSGANQTTTDGSEGSMSISANTSDLANSLTQGQMDSVLAVDIEAEDSDINLERVDVAFVGEKMGAKVGETATCVSADSTFGTLADVDANVGTGVCEKKETRPWKTFDKVQLILDGDVIATKNNLDSSDFVSVAGVGTNAAQTNPYFTTSAPYYRLRFSGIDERIVEDDEVKLEVAVRVLSSLNDNRQNQDWGLSFNKNGIRGEDEAGLNQFAGTGAIKRNPHDNDSTPVAEGVEGILDETGTSRVFTVAEEAPGLSATKDDTDVDKIARVSSKSATDDIVMGYFKLSNGEDDPTATLQEMTFDIAPPSGVTFNAAQSVGALLTGASLYEGSTLLDSVDVGSVATDITFEDLDLEFDEDEDRTFTLKIDVAKLNALNEGKSLVATLDSFQYDYGPEEESETSDVDIDSETVSFYATSPIVTVSGTPTFTAYSNTGQTHEGQATFNIRVQAVGGDVWIGAGCDDSLNTGYTLVALDNAARVLADDYIGLQFRVDDSVDDSGTSGNKKWYSNDECDISDASNATKVKSKKTGDTTQDLYKISKGNTATFTLTLTVTTSTSTDANANRNVRIELDNLWWKSENDTTTALDDLDLSDLELRTNYDRLSKHPS